MNANVKKVGMSVLLILAVMAGARFVKEKRIPVVSDLANKAL